jgi:hypothetical protein
LSHTRFLFSDARLVRFVRPSRRLLAISITPTGPVTADGPLDRNVVADELLARPSPLVWTRFSVSKSKLVPAPEPLVAAALSVLPNRASAALCTLAEVDELRRLMRDDIPEEQLF